MSSNELEKYRVLLDRAIESLSHSIGVHVMLIVIERALWAVKHDHEEANLIAVTENGVDLERLSSVDSDRAAQIIHDLQVSIVSVLGNLVGKQMAAQLTNQIDSKGETGDQIGQ